MISDALLDALAQAISNSTQLPDFPAGITVADAYQQLPELAKRVSGSPAGIKAGITNIELQKLFGLEEALIGLLYKNRELQSGDNLVYSPHRRIECEMAVTFNSDGTPIAVGPAIEFVSLDFARPEDMTPGNVTLCNLGADQFIRGDMTDWDSFDFEGLSTLEIVATRDGETLLTTTPMDSLGGPRSAHKWCMAKAKALGYGFPEGGILL
ncbi:MAG: hypothetical protein DWQ28_06810, partial [Proteobacteria bacterium]